ncbi:hypothetical protein [Streptomyces griseoaurantiacus]|uniref:hypothetical protein n=1 Tax=Streptomyces griseoaurantiacus TaxID=68213 RepID=UPI002E28898F|nr:hypothetical protein [Streptomyces jietaisiensis]
MPSCKVGATESQLRETTERLKKTTRDVQANATLTLSRKDQKTLKKLMEKIRSSTDGAERLEITSTAIKLLAGDEEQIARLESLREAIEQVKALSQELSRN